MQTPENTNETTDVPFKADSQLTEVTNADGSKLDSFSQADDSSSTPRKYGRYTIQGNLGSGGFGRVYLAEDDELKRLVALKVPKLKNRAQIGVLNIYQREAQTVAALDLPGVVPVYDIGVESDGSIYIVSKYIRGSDLHKLMERGGLTRDKSIRLCITIAETLHQVHLHSIVHRDIKPGNILVDESGVPYIADFGLALRPTEYGRTRGRTGTLRYMSPEQVRGESHLVDGRSDLFSLGVILYELLTGQRPFEGPDVDTIQHCVQFIEPRPLRQIDDSIHPELERICLRALSKKASDRYSTGQDFADDLNHYQKSMGKTSPVHESTVLVQQASVVPRGLRAFRGRDSTFFMSLLPGPRGRDGLPDVVRQWKLWIEERSSEDTYRIGVIYGPSGCGKSSMLQAGILPLLGTGLDVVTIQATGESFDRQLKSAVHRYSPPSQSAENLDEISAADLIARRRDQAAPTDKPLLVVIDQFENWLLTCTAAEANDLAMTLRQCDGVTTKAILLVRDDFWVALSRFMSVVDVPLIPDLNCSLIDLFDPAHAKVVLESFGRAHNRIPPGELIEPAHAMFLDRAIEDLTQAGKVYPVQLALFAEMLKGRPWVPDTLDTLGGVEGIGTQFLEETFEAEHAPVKRRIHQTAARNVLASLLPDAGTDVRTRFRSLGELQEISGYKGNAAAFRDLIQLLDTELKLISPTDRFESTTGGSTRSSFDSQDSLTAHETASYQLSHDFLIPSLREWISKKQLETYLGRVQSQFTEIAGLWSGRQAKRFLPSWVEWLKFSLLIPGKSMTTEQRQMMKYANRRHLTSTFVVLLCVVSGSLFFRSWQQWWGREALLKELASARLAEVPSIAVRFRQIADLNKTLLPDIAKDEGLAPDRRLAAEMVLLQQDRSRFKGIIDNLVATPPMEPSQIEIVGSYLAKTLGIDLNDPASTSLPIDLKSEPFVETMESLWSTLENPAVGPERRLAACHVLLRLGQFKTAENLSRCETISKDLAEMLVNYAAFHPSEYKVLANGFRPAMRNLVEPLSVTIGAEEPSLESNTAINLLLDFFADDPRRLADLALDASPWQLAILVPEISRRGEVVVPVLREVVRPHLKTSLQELNVSHREAIRLATAAALLARMSESEPGIWNLLMPDPSPTLRSTLIHRFADVGVPRERLMQRLVDEQTEPVLAALLMTLGQYEAPKYSELADQTQARVLSMAVGAREAGTMSAANWLAKKWKLEDQLATQLNSPPGGSPASPNWHGTTVGLVMSRVDASLKPDIQRIYEISTTEVSVKQFHAYDQWAHYENTVSETDDCPMNIVRWKQALKFCRWLSEKEGIVEDQMCYPKVEMIDSNFIPDPDHVKRTGYRLPTVAEWTYACQANTKGVRFFGENLQLVKFYAVFNEDQKAMPCGSLKPNDLGLFDMFGNIMEWTGDIDGEGRKLCGGSYALAGDALQAGFTRTALPDTEFNSIGFRVARTISP
jgi:eukaryotic-like serine/threonine-protein kinase